MSNLSTPEKWQEIKAAMREHLDGKLSWGDVMGVVGSLK